MTEGIAAAGMSKREFENAYDIAILNKSMISMASQAEALIDDMLAAVPTPGQYGFDIQG
ncbi:MAG: hypothetical protein HDT14_08750 [Oscillibacter sp.]|nr:hypothetical protein [Oscillibacter sp.]